MKFKLPNKYHFNFKLGNKEIFSIDKDRYLYQYEFLHDPGNILEFGPTRSGKTQTIIFPIIEQYSRVNNFHLRPSMVVGDPKGELFENMSAVLEARGYEVWCINMKDETFVSTDCYNPLTRIYDKYNENFLKIKPFLDMDAIRNAKHPVTEYWNQILEGENKEEIKNTKYTFSPAIKLLEGISALFIPTDDGKDPYWPQNAQGWMNSLLYYMLETCILLGEPNKFSIRSLVAYLSGSDSFVVKEDKQTKKVSSEFHDALSELPIDHFCNLKLPKDATVQQHGTFKNNVASALSIFTGGAGKVTSLNTIKLEELLDGKKPVCLFLATPDYDSTYNVIVGTMIEQIYQLAAEMSDKEKLKRGLKFILDEFANIPKIDNIENKVSVCLGRNINFTFILQNKEQADKVYGNETTQTIFNNALARGFIGGNTRESCEYFSEQIGTTTKQFYRIDIENGKSGVEVHHEEKEERLIKPEELFYRLEMGNAVHIIKGVPNPILGDLVPAFTYMSKNPKTSFEEFYDKKDISQMPHLTVTDNDLVFKNLITPNNCSLKGK